MIKEMRESLTYRITIRTIQGNILKFNRVESYSTTDGILEFTDSFTHKVKRFSTSLEFEIEDEL
jgi:hypothetical protein